LLRDALPSKYISSPTVEHLNKCMRVPVTKGTLNCNKLAEEIVSSTTLNFISLFGRTTFQKEHYMYSYCIFNNRKKKHTTC
jgi:hypothetical protein